MSIIKLRNGKSIGDYQKPYIVAELNTSHFGDIGIAFEMIRAAKLAGCNCVKFQSWSAGSLYCDDYYKSNTIAERIFKKFALGDSELQALSTYASELEIDFSSTPYSMREAIFLVDQCNVPFVKIASMELDNLPYLRDLATLNIPLILSTGMGEIEEIRRAVATIENAGNEKIIILHCTSVYPSAPEVIRLRNISGLRSEFPRYPIGYSDHSVGINISAASLALGACLIEKHFTLDRSRIGMDNQMAMEPDDMRTLVKACNEVYAAMGGSNRVLSAEERDQIPKMRRSMVARMDLPAGTRLSKGHVEFKRPGIGISPADFEKFIGLPLKKPVKKGATLESSVFDLNYSGITDNGS